VVALSTPAPWPTRIALTPATTWTTYTDPNVGFSFQYPSNWFFQGSAWTQSRPSPNGYGVTIRNYDDKILVARNTHIPEELKIELGILTGLSNCAGLDDWIARSPQVHDTRAHDLRTVTIAARPGRRWTAKGALLGDGVLVAAVGQGDRLYLIYGYAANTRYTSVFDHVVQTFRLP
jgi:hypothetical protein